MEAQRVPPLAQKKAPATLAFIGVESSSLWAPYRAVAGGGRAGERACIRRRRVEGPLFSATSLMGEKSPHFPSVKLNPGQNRFLPFFCFGRTHVNPWRSDTPQECRRMGASIPQKHDGKCERIMRTQYDRPRLREVGPKKYSDRTEF